MLRLPDHRSPILLLVILLAALWSPGLVAAAVLNVSGPAGMSIWLDGKPLGKLPLAQPVQLAAGRHELRGELPGYADYRDQIELMSDDIWLNLQLRPTPLSLRTSLLSNLVLAGLGQHYQGHTRSGWLYMGIEVGGLVTALLGELSMQNHREDYLLLRAEYEAALGAQQIDQARSRMLAAHDDVTAAADLRDTGLLVAAGAVAVSLLDAWLRMPGRLEAGAGSTIAPLTQATERSGAAARSLAQTGCHVGCRFTF
jgi:hypothetical protein